MLSKYITEEIANHVVGQAQGELLTPSFIEAMSQDIEEVFGVPGLTRYNVTQILGEFESPEYETQEELAGALVASSYDKSPFIKTFKKIKEADHVKKSRILGGINDFLEHLDKHLEAYQPKEDMWAPSKRHSLYDGITVCLTDLHIGKVGTAEVINRMYLVAEHIVATGVDNVDIICLGDLVESLVQGGNHSGQIEEMDNTYGFDLIMKAVESFEGFITMLLNEGIQVNFHGLSGNHDRFTQKRDDDNSRLGGLVIYELLKRGLSKQKGLTITIYREFINPIDIRGKRYIIAHGDMARIPSRKASDIAWNHGDNRSHNVIMHGHLHNLNITEEKNVTKIGMPGLAGPDRYAKGMLDLHSEPGFVSILHNQYDTVDVIITRLPNN